MKRQFLYPILLIIPFVISCEKTEEKVIIDPKPLNLPAISSQIISNSNNFGIDLFKKVSEEEDGNLMLSPLSASTALTMLMNGCHGETYNQIHQMLGYGTQSLGEVNQTYQELVSQLLEVDPKVKLAIANAVFYREDFNVKAPFIDTMESVFGSHIEGLDFSLPSALTTINKWASDNTYEKIPKVLDEIYPDAVMFLMNALYFKGNWTYEFEKSKTHDGQFLKDDGTSITVKMMEGYVHTKFYNNEKFYAVELPYGRTNFTMDILVPVDDLQPFIAELTNQDWDTMTSYMDGCPEYSEITLVMPKFKFEFEKQLKDQLKALGMIDAFNPLLADLSGISDADIYVNFVKQNTFVDVNEEGTEAAAVTTIGIFETSMPNNYTINKPFVFAIRERTSNTLLFLGKVDNPVY